MKKLLLSIILAIVLVSCSKEYSYEKECGTIISKQFNRPTVTFTIKVQYNNYVESYEFPLIVVSYNTYQVGDQYCK